jgi:hypothetical protein
MSELDHYLDRLGGKLERARPRRRRRPLVAIPALAVVIVAATLVFGPGGQRHPVDAVAAARAALDADGQILHMKVRVRLDPSMKIARGAKISGAQEQWSQSDPKRWRFRETRTDGSWAEFAYADGTATDYDSDRNRVRRITGFKDTDPQARPLGLLGVRGGGDPDAGLKAMLATGKVTDVGLVQADGREVRRLEGKDRYRDWVYDVDPETFAPVSVALTTHLPNSEGSDTMRLVIELYERIPLGADVFTPRTKPDATVTTRTKQQFLAAFEEQRRREKVWGRCVKRNHGSHKGCGPSPYLDMK